MVRIDEVVVKTKSSKATKAKNQLMDFVKRIDKRLELYFAKELNEVFGVSEKEKKLSQVFWEHIREHNLRPAKRIRGSFVYYGYKMFGGDNEEAIMEAAMSVELVHTALLMHDDFMDEDAMRRGKLTTHEFFKAKHDKLYKRGDAKHYGEAMAVNVGDMALCAGYEILGRSSFEADKRLMALNRMLRGIGNTALGQGFDIELESKGVAEEQDIFDLHLAKTAIYTYENPLHVGAILAGASGEDLELLSEYAVPGGVAFQLQDDILGMYGDPEKTGKPAHSDLRQGKMTLLIIKAFERTATEQRARLEEIWGKSDLNEEEAKEAREIIEQVGSLDYSRKISVQWAKKAQEAVIKMKEKGWDNESIEYLDGIAQYMVEREI